MDYFRYYNLCLQYYSIYNRRVKCREYIEYIDSNNTKLFLLDEKYHNILGPAFINFYDNGVKAYEVYYIDDKRHNINGPAIIEYNDNGVKAYEVYYINNILQE